MEHGVNEVALVEVDSDPDWQIWNMVAQDSVAQMLKPSNEVEVGSSVDCLLPTLLQEELEELSAVLVNFLVEVWLELEQSKLDFALLIVTFLGSPINQAEATCQPQKNL